MLQRRIAEQKWDPSGEKLSAGPELALALRETADRILTRVKNRNRDPGKSSKVSGEWQKQNVRREK